MLEVEVAIKKRKCNIKKVCNGIIPEGQKFLKIRKFISIEYYSGYSYTNCCIHCLNSILSKVILCPTCHKTDKIEETDNYRFISSKLLDGMITYECKNCGTVFKEGYIIIKLR